MRLAINNISLCILSVSLLFLLSACGGGSNSSNDKPEANAGPDVSVRMGAEIVLSGRDSYDHDGPIMAFSWQQVSGPTVTLTAVTQSSVKFTAPSAADNIELVFELSVEDNLGRTDTDQVIVTAVGPIDSDRFLSYFGAPTDYIVEVALDDSVDALTTDVNFDLVMSVTQSYKNLAGDTVARVLATDTRSGTWTSGQQMNKTYPQFSFDIPAARIEDLVDVNKSARDDIRLNINLNLANVGAAVDYIIQVLDDAGVPIENTNLSTIQALNTATPSGINIDVNLLLDNLGNELAESQTTANAYYAAIDPNNEKTTLSDWLVANDYNEANAKRAKYLNGFDLAFGRDMQVWKNDQNHVFAVVENYPNIDGLMEGTNHIGTVAMEYSPGPSGGDPYTKYYTFVRDPQTGIQQRVGSMDFDGRGEKFTPGNCVICHGGQPAALADGVYPNEGNINGGFLLWDVETFAFSDGEYEGRTPEDDENTLSKSDQQDEFKFFNETLLLTNITAAQRDLIYGWYGGEALPDATPDDEYIPLAWQSPADGGPDTNPETASDFYLNVFAPTCRACHYGLADTDLQFASYGSFIAAQDAIIQRVFNEGTMPLARITMDNFWVGTQAEAGSATTTRAQLLAEHLAVDIETQQPGNPSAVIISESVNSETTNILPSSEEQSLAVILRHDQINLSAQASLYGESYAWEITRPNGSAAALNSQDQATAGFVADTYGDYDISLTIQNQFGSESVANYTYRVENNVPVAGDFAVSIKEDEVALVNVLTSPTALGDGDVTSHAVLSVSNEIGGIAAIGSSGNISFTPTGVGDASFYYQITDVDDDQSAEAGSVTVTVSALPNASNDSESASVGTASDSRAVVFPLNDILGNDTLGVEPTSVVSVSYVSGSLTNGLDSCNGEQGVLSFDGFNSEFDYMPPVACAGTENYQYTIRDSNNDESTATITITVSNTAEGAFSHVVTAIANGGCAASFCHDDSHVMDLSSTSSAIWADLTECNLNTPDDVNDCLLGNRLDLSAPADSLLLQKALGNSGHGGGAIFPSVNDEDYLRILRWVEEGAVSP